MKRILTLVLLLLLVGCSYQPSTKNQPTSQVTRIVSIGPSNTEILIGLGLQAELVAVDEFSKTSIGGFNQDVVSISFNDFNVEAIINLKPQLVVTTSLDDHLEAYQSLSDLGIEVVNIAISTSIEDIKNDITLLGSLTNTQAKALEITKEIDNEVNEIKAIAQTIPLASKKKVFFEISPAPSLFTVGKGTYLNEYLEIIGAINIFKDEQGWPNPSAESLVLLNPDVYISSVSYDVNTKANILNEPAYQSINAIINKQV
ncbi:MAG: ABC transporter substrate-binding protein, partial [Bacilli bacterium]